jgi:hypothetical protein
MSASINRSRAVGPIWRSGVRGLSAVVSAQPYRRRRGEGEKGVAREVRERRTSCVRREKGGAGR